MAGGKFSLVAVVLALVHLSTAAAINVKIVAEGRVTMGSRAKLICYVTDNSSSNTSEEAPGIFQWFKDDEKMEVQNRTLIIPFVLPSHEGNYSCRVLSLDGQELSDISGLAPFTVLVPPVVTISQRADADFAVAEGGNLTLTCRVVTPANPRVSDHAYTWRFRADNGGQVRVLKETRKDLIIHPAYRNQTGRYDCEAVNGVTLLPGLADPENASIDVQVQYLDDHVILTPKEWRKVKTGDKVTLTCRVNSVPTANLTWLHQGRVLHTVESNEDVYSFTATGCQDSGEYQCKAENNYIPIFPLAQTKITVKGCAPELVEGFTSPARVTVTVGDNVTLTVTVIADPAPSFLWSGPGLSSAAAQSPSLALYSLQPQQAGLYTVSVSNKHGSLNHTFVLEVVERDTPSSGGLPLWLQVGGGVVAVLLCLTFVCLLLCRKRLVCFASTGSKSAGKKEHQYTGLYSRDYQDRTIRSQEVGDYASGESTGQYMSIDSADLSWQPQAVQPQDSLSQVTEERGYDVPPPPVCVMSSGTRVLRHLQPQSCDVADGDDVSSSIRRKCKHKTKRGYTLDKASSSRWRGRRCRRASDPESEDSESYLACQVVSHGLPPSSLPSHSPIPQGDYLTPVHQDASGERAPPRPHRAPGLALKTEKKPRRSSF